MKQMIYLKSLKGTHFTGAIAQNAKETENIVVGVGSNDFILRSLNIQSKENLIWEVHFWHTDAFTNADLDLDTFAGVIKFTATSDGVQLGGAAQYYYVKHDLYLPLRDRDGTGEIHLALVNRSAGAKTAGTDGQVVIELALERAS